MSTTHPTFVIRGVRVFDGADIVEHADVTVDNGRISAIRVRAASDQPGPDPVGGVVDGAGATLLPGLIDSHTHPADNALAEALRFGVTTEMDLFNLPEKLAPLREQAAARADVADLRSASTGATVLGGHPSMLIELSFKRQFPVVEGPEHAAQFVRERVAEGADFIKLFIDDGTALGHDVPTLDAESARRVVEEAHAHGLLAVAHVTSAAAAKTAVEAGVDGLVHIYMDVAPTPELTEQIRAAGIFVVPTLITMGTLSGDLTGQSLAEDPRASAYLNEDWQQNLCACWHFDGPGALRHAQAATTALLEAGVRVLAGTDAADVGVHGTAHGASLHQELRLLVECGMTPTQALRSATLNAARSWRLHDRGAIAPGLRADLVLVDGDPTVDIDATLDIREVWRAGVRLERTPEPAAHAERPLATAH